MKQLLCVFVFLVAMSQDVIDRDYKYQWDPLTNTMKLLPREYKIVYNFPTNSYVYVNKRVYK